MWISSICESSHAPCVGMIRGSRNKQASNTFADMHQFCLSENSHVVLAGACVPCDRHVKLVMSVHLRQLQLLVFEQNWGCAQGLQQRLASSTATPAESKQ